MDHALYFNTTSVAAQIKNTFQRTSEHNQIYIKRDSAHNFSFSYIKRGFVEFPNKQ